MINSYVIALPDSFRDPSHEMNGHYSSITEIMAPEDLVWAVAQHPTDPGRVLRDLCTSQEEAIDDDDTLDQETRLDMKNEWYSTRVMAAVYCIDALTTAMVGSAYLLQQPNTMIHDVTVKGNCMVVALTD